jgi:hypothetical protein
MLAELTESVIETIRSAARKLSGFRRRQFQAEMAAKYCDSNPRRAEQVFGWGRDAVNTGLNELRSGIRCLEETCPWAVPTLRGLPLLNRLSHQRSPAVGSAFHC